MDSTSFKFVKNTTSFGDLGNLLRVDFSPHKVCSFNCRYCGVGPTTRKIVDREAFYPVEDVFGEIQDFVDQNDRPDYVMLTGSGEPTLYAGFGRLATMIRDNLPGVKSTLYSNGSLLYQPEVREQVAVCDLVMINLNTVDEKTFQRICRPHKDVDLGRMIDGVKQFRADYAGPLWMDVVLVKDVNDSEQGLERLMATVLDIGPDRYRVRTVGRAIEKVAEPVPAALFERLEQQWADLPLEIEYIR